MHGGAVSGIGLILMYVVGEFCNKKPFKELLPYIYVLIPTILVLVINPWGFSYLEFLLKATTMQRPDVVEWWGLFSKHNVYEYMNFKIIASIIILSEIGVIIKQLLSKTVDFDKTKFIVLVVTLFLAIQHVKLIPFFVIAAMSFIYDDFYTVFNNVTGNIFNRHALFKDTLIYLIFIIFIFSNLRIKSFGPILTKNKYPIRSIEFIKINDIKGDLLTNFAMGSYASYKLYPNNKIYIDGRYEEVYYDYMLQLLRKFCLMISGWDELLKRFPPDVIIIEKSYPIYNTLKTGEIWTDLVDTKKPKDKHNYHWTLVFEEKDFGVFVQTKNLKKTYKEPPSSLDYYKKTLFDTNINFKPHPKLNK